MHLMLRSYTGDRPPEDYMHWQTHIDSHPARGQVKAPPTSNHSELGATTRNMRRCAFSSQRVIRAVDLTRSTASMPEVAGN